MTGLPELLVIAFLVMLNGLFAASEMALVTVRRSRLAQLAEEGHRAALAVERLKDNPGRFLAVIQIGITFLGFLASAFAAVSIVDGLEAALATLGPIAEFAGVIALVVVTGVLTLFTIVFGELVPKQVGLAHAERVSLAVAWLIDGLGTVFGPLVASLTWLTRQISRLFRADVTAQERISADELRLIIEQGGEQGILEAEEEQMIHAVIELGERKVHEVMVPRVAIASLPQSASFEEAIDLVVQAGHSRIPVYLDSIDEIVGILYAKDLLPYLKPDAAPRPPLRKLLRPPVLVPESMSIDDLLHELQRRKVHIAVVLDEYGGTAGLVTIEDLLEEIVGEIQDEYDVEEPLVVRISDDEARIDGRLDVDELLELFDLADVELEDDEEYDTVGGLLYHRVGGVPSPGDTIEVEGLRLTVESTDGRRVGKVLVVREGRPDRPDDGGNGARRGDGPRRREGAGRKPANSRKRVADGE
ncbi:MAG TPA: hemolysin family protein [Candidatus Deferrimicrobiaceae bacterium]|nr:hemolysin family protein [Candidatus Deferrimicrobiaceae bacterium]